MINELTTGCGLVLTATGLWMLWSAGRRAPRDNADCNEALSASAQTGHGRALAALKDEVPRYADGGAGPRRAAHTLKPAPSTTPSLVAGGRECLNCETEPPAGVDARSTITAPAMEEGGTTRIREAALRFMRWLQQGILDGSIPVNQPDAWVHFVAEGMLLVSPRVFREFAKRFGKDGKGGVRTGMANHADAGKSIQRQVLRARWHARGEKGVNFFTYQLTRPGRAASRLTGVLIKNPERFVKPVPPANPLLAPVPAKRSDG